MVDFSPQVVSEILSKLPIKSLLRFKCVSKQWLDLIDSPFFVGLHLAAKTNTVHIMRRGRYGQNHFLSLTFDLLNNTTVKSTLTCPLDMIYSTFVGTCNGVTCLAASLPTPSIVFWNPETNKYKQGPFLKNIHSCNFGFGVDNKSRDYKLVMISAFGNSMRAYCQRVRIYSVKSDSWFYGHTKYGLYVSGKSVFINGALHWLARHVKSHVLTTVGIDVSTGEWLQSVPLPKSVLFPLDFNPLTNLGGVLCIVSCSDDFADADVFVLTSKCWNKVFSIDTFGFGVPWPLGYGGNGKQVLVLDGEGFKWYDIETKTVTDTDVSGGLEMFEVFVCGESHAPIYV